MRSRANTLRGTFDIARRGPYEIDATDEAADLGRWGRQVARRGPQTEERLEPAGPVIAHISAVGWGECR